LSEFKEGIDESERTCMIVKDKSVMKNNIIE